MDEIKEGLEQARRDGHKEVDVQFATEMMKTILNESAQLFSFVLFNTPEAKNYLKITFECDSDPDKGFNVILQKRGKGLPGNDSE
jgi:hypothetical protein